MRTRGLFGLGLVGSLVALGCDDRAKVDDATAQVSAIISGTTANAASVNQPSIAAAVNCTNGSSGIKDGSAVFLTNNWVITAAHVVDGKISNCNNGLSRADSVTISFGSSQSAQADAVIMHPRYGRQGHTDIALLHAATPFSLSGSNTGYNRPIHSGSLSSLFGRQTSCFGYGRSSRTTSASGVLRTAPVVIGPSPPAAHNPVAGLKGGGAQADDFGNNRILAPGDSGGGCVDPTGPTGHEELFGIHRDSEVFPECNSDGDCPDNGTCTNNVCSSNDASFSNQQAASSFRDFTRAVLGAAAPPFQVDFDGNGLVDVTMFVLSQDGFFVLEFVDAFGAPFPFFTFIPDNGIVGDTVQSFVSLNTGDFNDDGTSDILALVGGFPFYFNSNLGSIDLTNPFNGTLDVDGSEGFAFSMVDDFNGDGFTDAELVRDDGTSKLFLGSAAGLESPSAPQSYGPDFDGDGLEDIAMSAPGTGIPPEEGAVHILFGDNTAQSWSGDTTNGPDSAPGDFYGGSIAWGNFDGDAPDELLAISRGGLRYIDQAHHSFIDSEAVSDPPFTTAFGAHMAVGDFDGDGLDDVALTAGARSEQIQVLFGAVPDGLTETSRRVGFVGEDIGADNSGFVALGAGDFNCDGRDDLALGYSTAASGRVVVVYGSSSGPSTGNAQHLDASDVGAGDGATAGDRFGAFLLGGNFNGDDQGGVSCDDLAVAATRQNGGDPTAGGTVYVIYGTPFGLGDSGNQAFRPGSGTEDFPDGNFGFGRPMALSHLDTDRFDDLLVGWPSFQGSSADDIGRVYAYRGGSSGLNVSGVRVWTSPIAPTGGAFGLGLGGTSTGLVAVGTPFTGGSGHPIGRVDVIEPNGNQQGASIAYGPNDFPETGFTAFGSEITGPRPGRLPPRVRARVGLTSFTSAAIERMELMSFEDPKRGWKSTAPLALDYTQKTKGVASLVVNAAGSVALDSAPFGTTEIQRIGDKLALDVFVPATQPNPNWLGDVQMSMTIAAANVNNTYLGYVPLTGLVRGQWNTIEFPVPAEVRTAMLGDFPRAQFKIALNTPNGAQPLRIDNLRFRGTLTERTVQHGRPSAPPVANNPLFSFENLADWSSPQGSLALTTFHVAEGSAALSIPGRGWTEIRSRAFSTSELSGVTSRLALSVFIPSTQTNPSWVGDVQAFFSCPSAGLTNVALGQVVLTHLFHGEYNRVTFNLPASVVSALTSSHADARFTFALSVGTNANAYAFDDLGFVP